MILFLVCKELTIATFWKAVFKRAKNSTVEAAILDLVTQPGRLLLIILLAIIRHQAITELFSTMVASTVELLAHRR